MDQQQQWMDYSTFDHRALSLNLSGLSVASPATPVTPSATSYHHQPFAYDGSYEHTPPPATLRTARSKKAPSPTVTVSVEPADDDSRLYDDEARDAPMELADAASYDFASAKHGPLSVVVDSSANGTGSAGGTSPIEGSNSPDDPYGTTANGNAMGSSMNVLGKPLATNNFVTKLYQMINDPKSAQYIVWTELGTSFVVSNVGEFSRSILGSHFKHNNFSSFVRQLNMYGFHKINRTPRAQRTSTDAQTWEFSHHKFLRGRPDLLDEIKRKALEPDPTVKHRVELPGEVAAQLTSMREENRKMWDQLQNERRKVEKLVGVVGRLWDVVGKTFPGSVPQFPPELLDSDSPNIYITSPTSSRPVYPPPLSMNMHGIHSSPNSSPTATDYPHHPSLSRQHSFQHGHYSSGNPSRGDSSSSTPLPSSPGSISMDLYEEEHPVSRSGTKRPRLDENGIGLGGMVGMGNMGHHPHHAHHHADAMGLLSSVSSPGTGTGAHGLNNLTIPKKNSRARSDSAPMYASGGGPSLGSAMGWQHPATNGAASHGLPNGILGRPRSGSGLVNVRIPNIGTMGRQTHSAGGTPLLNGASVGSTPEER